MVLQDDPNGVTLVNPTTGTQLALKYNPDHIMLSYHSKTRHGTPYIAYESSAEGMMLRIRDHTHLMHADQVAEYLMNLLLRDEMPESPTRLGV